MRKKRSASKVKEREAEFKRQKQSAPEVKKEEAGFKRQKRQEDKKVKEKEAECKRQIRKNPKVRKKEMQSKGQKCANYEYNQKEAERNVKRMKTLRKSELYREKEMVQKRTKHLDASFKKQETIQNTLHKQKACQDLSKALKEKELANSRKYGSNMTQLLHIFNASIAEGPLYVCTCQQIWFKHSVLNIKEICLKNDDATRMFETCRTKYVSKDKKEWICKTCRNAIKDGKIPKLSVANKMGFLPIPPELKLYVIFNGRNTHCTEDSFHDA